MANATNHFPQRLVGRRALVTGGGSGFGAGIAKRFAAEGAQLVINDLIPERAEQVAAALCMEFGAGRAMAAAGDVSNAADTAHMVAVADAGSGLDILVLNAGYSHANKPMLAVTEDEFDRIYAVNVKAIFLAMQAAVPRMQQRGGAVIITASTAGIRPRPGLTWYNGSKAAAIGLAKSLAVELAPHAIRVNALCPVIGETAMLETFMGMADTPENRAKFLATIPLGRMSRPAHVAAAAAFLAADESAFITGTTLEVDGGRSV